MPGKDGKKQTDTESAIINAALCEFGKLGFKKASAGDIAAAAGISKGMVFHCFGSKKGLYLRLLGLTWEMLTEAFENGGEPESDFFDRVMRATKIKLSILKEHPALFEFLTSVYYETAPEVSKEIGEFINKGEAYRNDFALSDIDTSKFKATAKPELVLGILLRFTQGYIAGIKNTGGINLDALIEEFTACMDMMKNNFYKEEYL